MEKSSSKTLFNVLFLFAKQQTNHLFPSRLAKALGFITGLYPIVLGLTMLGILIKLYIDTLFGSSRHSPRPSQHVAHTDDDEPGSLYPTTTHPTCTYLRCATDDHNGFVTGYLGRMQYALDKRILEAKGYHVRTKPLSTQSLRLALMHSDIVVFRGHGGVIDAALNQHLSEINHLTLSKSPTLIFQACSIAKQHPPQPSVSRMMHRFATLGVTRCFAAEQDYVASTYRFNRSNQIIGVDYIPWYHRALPGLGLRMNPIPMSGLPANTFAAEPMAYRNPVDSDQHTQHNIILPTNEESCTSKATLFNETLTHNTLM